MSWRSVPLGQLIRSSGRRAGRDTNLTVYSVTKHRGFVPSLDYFSKQVFGRELGTYKVVETGEFAFATIHLDEGSIGRAPQTGLVSPMYTVFAVDEEQVDPEYLLRFLKSPLAMGQYSLLGNGTAERRKSISLVALSKLPIPLPSLQEQRRIVGILDTADAALAKRRMALNYIDQIADALFAATLRDQKGSTTVTLASISTKITDGTHQSPHWETEGVPFLFISNIIGGGVDYSTAKFVSEKTYLELTRTTPIEVGDVLYSAVGSYGMPAVVVEDRPFVFQRHIAHIKPRCDLVDSSFLRAALASPGVKRQADRVARGAAQKTVTLGELAKFEIPAVSLESQKLFAHRLAGVTRLKERGLSHQAHLDELIAALKQRAFAEQQQA